MSPYSSKYVLYDNYHWDFITLYPEILSRVLV